MTDSDSNVSRQSVREKASANDVRSLLRRGLLAGRAGDYADARRWFRAALDADRDNVTALLWLAWLAPTRRETLALLSRVLELDPHNEHAQAGLRWARHHPSSSQDSPAKHPQGDAPTGDDLLDAVQPLEPSPQPWLPARSDFLQAALHSPKAEENVRSGIAAHRARRIIGPLGLLLVVAVCLFVIGVALVAWYSPARVLAWVLPAPTPTVIPTPTLTPSPTTGPTISATATPTDLPTHIPSPTPTVPPSPPPTVTSVPLPVSSPVVGAEKWIDVDLTHQLVTAYERNTPVFQASVSTGLPNTPTVIGQFRIYLKLSATNMAGPGYYLPNVPYTMYFHGSYALHGTYWHNNFGQPMSHGCVNLRTEDAQWLFDWVDPPLPAGASRVRSSNSNPGTLVVVHN